MSASHSALRSILSKLSPATGPNGFEGLVALALSELSGLTFRLAASGAQFGRDASSSPGLFAIAMEAKRYDKKQPSLQELVGKAGLAGFALAGRIDLWVLAATVELSDVTVDSLTELLDEHGISLLVLDWESSGLPALATLLAATQSVVLPWMEANFGLSARDQFEDGLKGVVADPRYEARQRDLKRALSASELGLDALRNANRIWAQEKFSSRHASQAAFHQYLAPLDPVRPMVDRPKLLSAMQSAVANWASCDVIALLGPEGVGKSWLVAQWWLTNPLAPILIMSAGRAHDLLRIDLPAVDMLATLLAWQQGHRDERAIMRWRRRLRNWRNDELPSQPRFAVVLDGLNETSGKPWAGIIRELAPFVKSLGGILIASCREGYWNREIGERSNGIFDLQIVAVTEYDDAELQSVLARKNINPSDLPEKLRAFIRNPRVCDLAIELLDQLGGEDELTIERLLLEYWRTRLLERGDLLAHNKSDFAKLLIRHAKAYRNQPGLNFDRDEWREYSGAAKRRDGRNLEDDLSDIEEGRFFNSGDGTYAFRPEALHFALGLLIVDEIKPGLNDGAGSVIEAVQRIIDAIRGFDIVTEIVASAIGIAALDTSVSDLGVTSLVLGWLSLQNLTDKAFEDVSAYTALRPNAFLDAFELRKSGQFDERLIAILLDARGKESVKKAMTSRIPKWLGEWSRVADLWGTDTEEKAKRQKDRQERIEQNLASLSEQESAAFAGLCSELSESAGLSRAAAVLMTDVPQVDVAVGIVGFAMTNAVASNPHSPYDVVAWAVRLNRHDHPQVEVAVRNALVPLIQAGGSTAARHAAAYSLNLLGSHAAAIDAVEFWEAPPGQRWRRVELFCDADPLDPSSGQPTNIAKAEEALAKIAPVNVWCHMGMTGEDSDIETVTLGMARFNPSPLIAKLRSIAKTAARREGLPLRQISWHMPELSPIFSAESIDAAKTAVERLGRNGRLVPDDDDRIVTAMFAQSLMPHMDVADQIDFMTALPPTVPSYFLFRDYAKPADEKVAEEQLIKAEQANVPHSMSRTLMMLSAHQTPVTPKAREIIGRCLNHAEDSIAGAAADFANRAADPQLDDLVLAASPPAFKPKSWRRGSFGRAYASAVIRRERRDLIDRVDPEFLARAASALGGAAVDHLASVAESALERLCGAIASSLPDEIRLNLDLENEESIPAFDIKDQPKDDGDLFERLSRDVDDKDGKAFEKRHKVLIAELEKFLEGLAVENALTMVNAPFLDGLSELAEQSPERLRGWLRRILAISDRKTLRQVQNLGFPLARALSAKEPELSASVFAHLWPISPIVNVTIGRAKIPLRFLTLFTASNGPAIDKIRKDEFVFSANDQEIEGLIASAEYAGQHLWLESFVDELLASQMPADHALGITIAGLRRTNRHSTEVLARDWPGQFLGAAAKAARYAYERDEWTRHWLELALGSSDAESFWRYGLLASAAADRRALIWADFRRIRIAEQTLGGELRKPIERRAKTVSEKREKTLYGIDKPAREQLRIMAEARAEKLGIDD